MKKKIVGILVCMLMVSSILANANVSNTDEGSQVNKNRLLFDIEDGEISVTVSAGDYDIKSNEQGDEISVENFGRLLVPGKPNLPSKIFSVAIPPGAEVVDVSFDASESIILPGNYKVCPVSLPRVIGEEDPLVYEQELKTYEENFNSVYGSDKSYPSMVVEFVRTAGYRKYNLVDIRVTPFTYHPQSEKLVYYPEVSIDVSYTFPEGFSPDEVIVDDLPRTEQTAEYIILNYDQAKNWYPSGKTGQGTYDYVIITLDSLTSSVNTLENWEISKGRSVNVVTTSWIDSNYGGWDLAEKMRNFLRDKYPSGEWGIEDVCLIGHYNDVPLRRTAQNVGYGQPETDYYYAELSLPDDQSWDADGDHQYGEDSDPIDFYAEVNVGRIPWSNPATVSSICQKSVAYEQNDDPAFKKNILLLGAFFWDDTDNAVLMEAKVDQPWMSDWTMTRMYEQGDSSYPMDYNLDYNNVKSVWLLGTYAFVNWAGHGSETVCCEYYPQQPFVDTDTCNYLNNGYPAIIFADACSNSDTDYLNIGQAMLRQGGVGFLGATKVAYGVPGWNSPDDGSSQSFDYFFTTCCTSGDYTQGEAHQWALKEMYTNGLWYMVKYEMFEWGALWGNPALGMAIVNKPPETPGQPDGPTEGLIGVEYMFSANTTDPEEDDVYYLFEWDDGTNSGWLGPYNSGETVEANHTWIEPEDYEIKVKAKDVNDGESEWSDPKIIHTIDVPILEMGKIKGGLFRISAVIKNIGSADAIGVIWSITVDGSLILLGKENSGKLANIPTGEEMTVRSGLILGFGKTTIIVNAEIPDGSSDTKNVDAMVLLFFIKT